MPRCSWGAVLLAGCSVSLQDVTPDDLAFAPPVNLQTITASIDTPSRVVSVELDAGDVTTEMVQNGTGNWVGTVPFPECSGTAEYRIHVTHSPRLGSGNTLTFPETGRFSRPVTSLPLACRTFPEPDGRTFEVLRTEDFPDENPGDGFCGGTAPDTTFACSLRAAVMEANASPGHDIIVVANLRHRLTLTGDEGDRELRAALGDLDVTESLTITGPPNRDVIALQVLDAVAPNYLEDDPSTDALFPKIDASSLGDRAFHVFGTDTVLHLQSVMVVGGGSDGDGDGGGILNEATIELARVILVGHRAESGGAMHNDGSLVARDLVVTHNSAIRGAGLSNRGEATLDRALFALQQGRTGAAIANEGSGHVTARNVTVTATDTGSPPDSLLTTRGPDSRFDASFVTVALDALTPTGAALVAEDDGRMTVHSTLLGELDGAACMGSLETFGGNVVEGPCKLEGTPLVEDHVGVGTIGTIGVLGDHGGFVPVVHVVPPPNEEWFDPRDLAMPWNVPTADARAVRRPIDGDRDGTAAPDPGAYEYDP